MTTAPVQLFRSAYSHRPCLARRMYFPSAINSESGVGAGETGAAIAFFVIIRSDEIIKGKKVFSTGPDWFGLKTESGQSSEGIPSASETRPVEVF